MPLIPTVIEKSQFGERAYDIYSRLLKDRIIFLGEPITDVVANIIIAQFLFLDAQDGTKDIKFYVNSPGGSVTAGMAASMGAMLLAAGASGKRFALPNAEVMIHQIMGGAEGQAVDIKIQAEHIL